MKEVMVDDTSFNVLIQDILRDVDPEGKEYFLGTPWVESELEYFAQLEGYNDLGCSLKVDETIPF